MTLRALRTFRAIAQHGSFARAGEVVGLTQPAASLQIKSLEEEFGTRLFDRSRRLPRLTQGWTDRSTKINRGVSALRPDRFSAGQ